MYPHLIRPQEIGIWDKPQEVRSVLEKKHIVVVNRAFLLAGGSGEPACGLFPSGSCLVVVAPRWSKFACPQSKHF